jgi:hypothetical protein
VINRGSNVWTRQVAILQQIHRAILTAPSPQEIPNIEFTILVNDHPGPNAWSLARHAAPSEANKEVNNTFLMPDYGFWSWPEPHIGSLDEVKEKVKTAENVLNWETKISKAVWRGSVHWNSEIRGHLVEKAKGKAWSDVQQLDWESNALTMEEFCKYKYLMYTEVSDKSQPGNNRKLHYWANTELRESRTRADCDTSNSAALSSSLRLCNGEHTYLLYYKQMVQNRISF